MSQLKNNIPWLSVQMAINEAIGCAEICHEGLYKQDSSSELQNF